MVGKMKNLRTYILKSLDGERRNCPSGQWIEDGLQGSCHRTGNDPKTKTVSFMHRDASYRLNDVDGDFSRVMASLQLKGSGSLYLFRKY